MLHTRIVIVGMLAMLAALPAGADAQASEAALFKPRNLRAEAAGAAEKTEKKDEAKPVAKKSVAAAKPAPKPAPKRSAAAPAAPKADASSAQQQEPTLIGEPVETPALAMAPSAPAPEAAPAADPAPEPVAAAAKPDSAPKAAAPTVNALEAGFGKITFNGLLQAWYTGGSRDAQNTFRVRRAEMRFTGDVTPQARWTVMVDVSKALSLSNTQTAVNGTQVVTGSSVNQAGRILQDASITLDLGEGVKLDAGQFKLPLSYEGLQSSAKMEIVERALFITDRSRGGAYGDIRDIGARISAPLGKHVDYQVGIYNGMGETFNSTDRNDAKTFAGRAVLRVPSVNGLHFGGSAAFDPGTDGQEARRQRVGGEVIFARGPVSLRSELMTGRDGAVRRLGYYAHADYKFTPKLQGVVRFDSWDPNTSVEDAAANVQERDYVAGLNYYITGSNVRVQAGFLHKTFTEAVPSRSVLLLNAQTSW